MNNSVVSIRENFICKNAENLGEALFAILILLIDRYSYLNSGLLQKQIFDLTPSYSALIYNETRTLYPVKMLAGDVEKLFSSLAQQLCLFEPFDITDDVVYLVLNEVPPDQTVEFVQKSNAFDEIFKGEIIV